jgi:hypothetical protein
MEEIDVKTATNFNESEGINAITATHSNEMEGIEAIQEKHSVAECCSALQCVAACYKVVQSTTECRNVL